MAAPAQALVMYEISGEMTGQFLPVTSDAAADLFGVSRGSLSTVDANIQIVIDPDDVPFVQTDTSVGQEVFYMDAIVSARVDINGVVFETTRRPDAGTQQNEIQLINIVAPSGLDSINITSQNGLSNLWTTQTVPFGQTIGGVFVDDAIVTIANLATLFTGLGTGWLDDYDLPTTQAEFAGLAGIGGTNGIAANLQFGIDLSPSFSQGFVQLTGTDFELTVTPAVPEPGAAALLLSGLALGIVARGRR